MDCTVLEPWLKHFIQNKMNANMKIISDRSIASNIVIKLTVICKIKFCKTQRVREHGWDWKFIVIFMCIKSLPKSTDTQWKFDKWRAFSVGKKSNTRFCGILGMSGIIKIWIYSLNIWRATWMIRAEKKN